MNKNDIAAVLARLDLLEARPVCKCRSCDSQIAERQLAARLGVERRIRAIASPAERFAAFSELRAYDRIKMFEPGLVRDFVDGMTHEQAIIVYASCPQALVDRLIVERNAEVKRVVLRPGAGQTTVHTNTRVISDAQARTLVTIRPGLSTSLDTCDPCQIESLSPSFGPIVRDPKGHGFVWRGLEISGPVVMTETQLDLARKVDPEIAMLAAQGRIIVEPVSRADSDAITLAEIRMRGERPKLEAW